MGLVHSVALQMRELYPGGAVVRADDGAVTAIEPRPDYARIAEACGAFGATLRCVIRPASSELRRALDEVQHGRRAVVDAVLKPIEPTLRRVPPLAGKGHAG